MTDTLAVSCRGLTKTFADGATRVPALRGIDLDVRRGELLMLVGPSGCGKTTLLSVVAGTLQADGGSCLLFGRDLVPMPPAQRTAYRGRTLGFVFQACNLLPMLTAAQNVSAPLLIGGMRWPAAQARACEALARVGLADRAASRPAQLSGGQQQRVAIARALVHDPPLILCDEPTSALDHETGQSVLALLRGLVGEGGRTVVVVTHDSRIFPFADRVVPMEDGRIAPSDSPPLPSGQRGESSPQEPTHETIPDLRSTRPRCPAGRVADAGG
jgi:putative ABC transport system ATP-binding protein